MPVLPQELKERYTKEYGLSDYDADVILQDKEISDFYLSCIAEYNQPKTIANWFLTEVLARVKGGSGLQISKDNLMWIIKAVDQKKIQRDAGKKLLSDIWGTELNAEEEAKRQDIMSDMSDNAVTDAVKQILAEKVQVVEQYLREQDDKILNFLVGQVMKLTRGKANAQEVMRIIKEQINKGV